MHSDQFKPKSYLKLNKKYVFFEGEQTGRALTWTDRAAVAGLLDRVITEGPRTLLQSAANRAARLKQQTDRAVRDPPGTVT